jgi:hypothetical protein
MKGEWLRRPLATTSVVFVHGILSSGETCWRHESGSYWPELLEAELDIEPVGIYVFSYETGVFSGSYHLGDIVDALKEHMRLDHVLDSDELIFVCHSMGGIVVRKFLVERITELMREKREIGLFLIASPSLGSSYADWLSPLAQFFGHSQASALRFVRGNDWLTDLDKEFTNLKEAGRLRVRGKELIEDKFIALAKLWRQQVVEPFSGAKYFGEPFKVPGSDHFSIAKPRDSGAIQHRLLVQFVKSILSSRPQLEIAAQDTDLLVLRVLQSVVEALHYSPRNATVRFTVSNLSDGVFKINDLRLIVTHRERVKQFRLPTPGAPYVEFALLADISEADSVDLLASASAQFILRAGDSDAFSVNMLGREGFRYQLLIECRAESLIGQGSVSISSAPILITYPIRTLEGLRHGS